MTDDDLCGYETDSGPCQNPATEGDSCWIESHGGSVSGHGRDPKLTRERQEGIALMLEAGHSQAAAARAHGIRPQTISEWKAKGRENPESIYGDFTERIARARAEGEKQYVEQLRHLASEIQDTNTLRWMLQQRFPDSWNESDAIGGSDAPSVKLPESVTKQWQRQPE